MPVFLKNFINLALNQGVNIGIALLITPLLFQALGEEAYGYVQLALSIMMLLSIVVGYGFHLNGPKRISLAKENSQEYHYLVNSILGFRVLLSVVMIALVVIVSCVALQNNTFQLILIASTPVLLSEALYPLFFLQGRDSLSRLVLTNVISKITYAILIVWIIKNPSDSLFVNLFFGGASAVVYFVFWVHQYQSNRLVWVRIPWSQITAYAKDNAHYFLSAIAGQVATQGGLIIVSFFITATELGKYALAQRIGFLLRMVPVFFTQAILQRASVLYASNKPSFYQYTNKVFWQGLALTGAMAIAVVFAAKWIIIVLSGEEIPYAVSVLQILAFIPFAGMLNFKNMLLILVDEKKELLNLATWITVIVMLFSACIGSWYYGGIGMAVALLVTEVCSVIIHASVLKSTKHA